MRRKHYDLQVLDTAQTPEWYETEIIPLDRVRSMPSLSPYVYSRIIPLSQVLRMPSLSPYIFYWGRNVHHPLLTARTILTLVHNHGTTGEDEYLQKAVTVSDAFLETSTQLRSARFFPYEFDFSVHRVSGITMKAPWYSGATQGVILLSYLNLYRATGERRFLDVAESVFESLVATENKSPEPWVARIDDQGFYWIEQWPSDTRHGALSGFLHAILGIYEYWLERPEDKVRVILEAALTTVECHIASYRNPGGISYYCLKHRFRDHYFHTRVVVQLGFLHAISREDAFRDMAASFKADYPKRFARLRAFARLIDFVKWQLRTWLGHPRPGQPMNWGG